MYIVLKSTNESRVQYSPEPAWGMPAPHHLISYRLDALLTPNKHCQRNEGKITSLLRNKLAAMLRWFTAGGAIHIAHYDVIDDVITRKLLRDRQKRRPPRAMKSCELSNGENRIALRQLLQNRKWVQDGNCKKWLERILVLVCCTI